MPVSNDQMQNWTKQLLGASENAPKLSLEQYLAGIPRLDSLADLPGGTAVLVRGDVDAKPGEKIGEGDERLRSMVPTLQYGIERGWKQVVFGHIGRKPEGSLKKVAARLGELLGRNVTLIDDWYQPEANAITGTAEAAVKDATPGSVLVLENTRKYDIERVLWSAKPEDAPAVAPKLAAFANEFAQKIATVYVNEALSAGSLDSSSTVVPAAMERVALGKYVAAEFDGPMQQCREAQVVIFSGLKIDKLDDLEAIIGRGRVRYVFAAGSLAMALKKAAAELDGQQFALGVAEDPAHKDKPYYIPGERIEQAKQMISEGRQKGIEFILPVDFVLADGQPSETIPAGGQQFDVGPKTNDYFARKVGDIISQSRSAGERLVVFHNGVFGMFEDPRFEQGTRSFVSQLKRMKDSGLEVYVGGGEGGAALDKYGQPDWVTHCFTAGGTVLNALSNAPVPYLQALYLASQR